MYNMQTTKIENELVNEIEEIKPKEFKETKETNESDIDNDIWQIEIPKINLIAPIAEGTSQDVMQEYVGHFEETKVLVRKCWTGST